MELEFIKNLAQIMNDAGLGELEYRPVSYTHLTLPTTERV